MQAGLDLEKNKDGILERFIHRRQKPLRDYTSITRVDSLPRKSINISFFSPAPKITTSSCEAQHWHFGDYLCLLRRVDLARKTKVTDESAKQPGEGKEERWGHKRKPAVIGLRCTQEKEQRWCDKE